MISYQSVMHCSFHENVKQADKPFTSGHDTSEVYGISLIFFFTSMHSIGDACAQYHIDHFYFSGNVLVPTFMQV